MIDMLMNILVLYWLMIIYFIINFEIICIVEEDEFSKVFFISFRVMFEWIELV